MQHGAVLRDVDVLAAEHGIDLLAQLRALRQVGQQLWDISCQELASVTVLPGA